MTQDDGKQKSPLRVETVSEGPAACQLRVEVDAGRVDRAFEAAYRQLGRGVRVRGFRPGKAPRSVLEKLYGAAVAEDVQRALVSETLPGAVEQADVVPVSEPGIDAEPPKPGEPFHYAARLEIKPPIELPDVQGLAARRPQVLVSDEEVERELEALREQHASWVEEPEGTAVARGHQVTVDFVGRVDGEPFEGGRGEGVTVEIGAGRSLPGFEDQLQGAEAGQSRDVRVRFPEDYPKRELAGKEAEFDVRIVAVQRRELPELDDEFAKDLGDFDSLDALRQRIRADLEARQEREARAVLRRTLMDSLIERVSVEVPPGVVQARLQHRLESARRELQGRVPPPALQGQLTQWSQEWRPLVEREIREEWILEAVAGAHGLRVSDEELDAHIADQAQERETTPKRLREAYQRAGLLEGLRAQLLEARALEFLLGGAKVEDATEA